MSWSSSSQVGLFFFSFFPPFFPPPQLLGRSFTLQLHLRTGCCRRWQVHSCLFPAAGIQRWSSRRGVTPANPSKKKKKSTQGPNFPGSCPAVGVAKSSTWMTGKALEGLVGGWPLLAALASKLALLSPAAEPRVGALQRRRGSGQLPASPASGNAQLNQSSSQKQHGKRKKIIP